MTITHKSINKTHDWRIEKTIFCFFSVTLSIIVLRTNWSLSDNSEGKMNDHKHKYKVLHYFLRPMMINVALVNLPQVNPGRTVKIGLELIIMVAFYLIWRYKHDHLCRGTFDTFIVLCTDQIIFEVWLFVYRIWCYKHLQKFMQY